MLNRLKSLWQSIRQLSGDDAYERYLAHFAEYHAGGEHDASDGAASIPLSKEDFFKQWQDEKWKGVKRCC